MSGATFISILNLIALVAASYIDDGAFMKPKMEKTNIVNKGVWIKRTDDDQPIKTASGDFIFRSSSLDADSLLHNNFDPFGDNFARDSMMAPNYVERSKRSANGAYDIKPSNYTQNIQNPILDMDHLVKTEAYALINRSSTIAYRNATSVIPKRSMQNDYESEIIKKIELTEEGNKTEESYETNKMDRNVFENEDRAWHQTAPMTDVNNYKILPKNEDNKNKNRPITEKGLVKVLSMLTKTFKKVMKQHNDIKKIHTKLSSINEEFMKNAQLLMTKFQDFDVKYLYLMKFNEHLKELEAKLRGKEEFYKSKEAELTKNLAEFEKQQKKFLVQQQQFYNIQKLMLAQNEKINLKQNLIAKTQNEISLRQNNFARILKKAKQIYIDTKNPIPQKLSAILSKPKESGERRNNDIEKTTTTRTTDTPNTESIKINLFSVPTMTHIENYDNEILKERDDHSVDDLIYKYYFNNTYIDVLMKNKVLSSFVAPPGNPLTRNTKSKRNEDPMFIEKSTNLIPVNEIKLKSNQRGKSGLQLIRGKRWIKYSKKNNRRKHIGKDLNINFKKQEVKPNPNKSNVSLEGQALKKTTRVKSKNTGKDPFWDMATSFCKGIGQDENDQMLHWCIEKALRRLRSIDMKLTRPTVTAEPTENPEIVKGVVTLEQTVPQERFKTTKMATESDEIFTTVMSPSTSNPDTVSSPASTGEAETTDSALFFPDNDQLESNLKQYDVKPDTEGTVYYDGSVHASQFDGPESDGISDLLPGMESDSRVDVDPLALDLQQRRRAYVRRINEDIMRQMKSG
ncbi:unnamed protein product, partial [Iphiclides podalirius]